MSRAVFLTIVSFVALAIGSFAFFLPATLIDVAKHADPSATANVMARTVGALLIAMGVLNFLVRKHADSDTLRAVLIANIVLQVGIIPIDPYAYYMGVFRGLDSFLPNTVLHLLLVSGFTFYLLKMKRVDQDEPKGEPL